MATSVIEQLKEYAGCYGGNGNCKKCFGDWNCGGSCHEHAKQLLQDLDIAEIKHGYWITHFDDLFPVESTQECSVCHEEEFISLCNENFCPNCGAKMDGEDINVSTK